MADPRLTRPSWRGRTNVDAYTIAWIEHAEQIVRDRWPKIAHPFNVTQGGYQNGDGDPLSAGAHDLGGGTDFTWCGHPECLLALRLAGGFAWHRTPEQGPWPHHIHGAPLGHPLMAPVLAQQAVAYLNRRNGLKNNGPDDGPRLDPIPRPVWPYPPEEDMPLNQDDLAAIRKEIDQSWNDPVEADGRSYRKMLRQASKAAGLEDSIADRVVGLLLNEPGDVAGTFDAEQIKAAVKQALREGTGD